jgi:hypothetical protein
MENTTLLELYFANPGASMTASGIY